MLKGRIFYEYILFLELKLFYFFLIVILVV